MLLACLIFAASTIRSFNRSMIHPVNCAFSKYRERCRRGLRCIHAQTRRVSASSLSAMALAVVIRFPTEEFCAGGDGGQAMPCNVGDKMSSLAYQDPICMQL